MRILLHVSLAACLFCLSTTGSLAGEVAPPTEEATDDLSKKLLGYWVIDFDSAATKSLIAAQDGDEEMRKEMGNTTFEIKEDRMMVYMEEEPDVVKITLKGQDPEKRTITADFRHEEEGEPTRITAHVQNDRLTLIEKQDDGEETGIGLKRIDKQEFEKRVPENLRNGGPVPDDRNQPADTADQYPIAEPVPDKLGFVISPHSGKVVDIREIPSGTLVADPHFDPKEKKYFRAP